MVNLTHAAPMAQDDSRWAIPLIACPATGCPIAIHGHVDPATFGIDLHGFVIDCAFCGAGFHEYDASDVFFDPADAGRFAQGGGAPA